MTSGLDTRVLSELAVPGLIAAADHPQSNRCSVSGRSRPIAAIVTARPLRAQSPPTKSTTTSSPTPSSHRTAARSCGVGREPFDVDAVGRDVIGDAGVRRRAISAPSRATRPRTDGAGPAGSTSVRRRPRHQWATTAFMLAQGAHVRSAVRASGRVRRHGSSGPARGPPRRRHDGAQGVDEAGARLDRFRCGERAERGRRTASGRGRDRTRRHVTSGRQLRGEAAATTVRSPSGAPGRTSSPWPLHPATVVDLVGDDRDTRRVGASTSR